MRKASAPPSRMTLPEAQVSAQAEEWEERRASPVPSESKSDRALEGKRIFFIIYLRI